MAAEEEIPSTGVRYQDWGPSNRIMIDAGDHTGQHIVPFLTGRRHEEGEVWLTLDDRFGVELPATLTREQQDSIVEFIANAISVGGGYASIYFTDKKMPFRG